MKKLVALLLLSHALLFLSASSLQAQCLPLNSLLELGKLPTDKSPVTLAPEYLPDTEWTHRGTVEKSKDLFWTVGERKPEGESGEKYDSWVSLRLNQTKYDVVFKTTAASCVNQLKSELRALKVKSEPVTCVECEGVRYIGDGYSVNVYSRKKGVYPFVVVVHYGPASTGQTQEASARTSVGH
jgi:hypothetical protein